MKKEEGKADSIADKAEESKEHLSVKSPEEIKEEVLKPHEIAQREKMKRKAAADELSSYKKRLKESVELKELQVRELELNVQFYNASKAWTELQPEIEELRAKEQAEIKASEEAQAKLRTMKVNDEIIPPEKKIIVAKGGTGRPK